jgi:hypothetical protein
MTAKTGEEPGVDRLSNDRVEIEAKSATGKISDVFGLLKSHTNCSLSIDEINAITEAGWSGHR